MPDEPASIIQRLAGRGPVGRRLFRIVFLTYIFLTLGITLAQILVEYRHVREVRSQMLALYEKPFEGSLANALWALDEAEIASILEGMTALPEVVGIRVSDPATGHLFGAIGWFVDERGYRRHAPHAGQPATRRPPALLTRHTFPIRFTHESGTEVVGEVILFSDNRTVVRQVLHHALQVIASAAAIACALWLVFAYCAARLLSAPLKHIITATGSLNYDHLTPISVRVPGGPENELRILSDTFNAMVRRLAAEIREREAYEGELRESLARIGALKEGLAATVKERTRELREANASLRQSEERFRAIVSNIGFAVALVDRNSRYVQVNAAWCEMLGYSQEEMKRLHSRDLTHPDDQAATHRNISRVLDGEIPAFRFEKRFIRKDGTLFWGDISASALRSPEGAVTHIIAVIADITDRKAAEERLRTLATTDALTGLNNRRQFMTLADAEFARSIRFGHPLVVAIVDVDHFKSVNDTHGHAAGDAVLRKLAAVIGARFRSVDITGRLGGEEFAVILPETDAAAAETALERFRVAVQNTVHRSGNNILKVTVSIGYDVVTDDTLTLEDLINQADKALYVAKTSGRNRTVRFTHHAQAKIS